MQDCATSCPHVAGIRERCFAPTLMKYGARDRLDAIPQSIVSESSITLSLCINSYYLMLLYYSLGTEFS